MKLSKPIKAKILRIISCYIAICILVQIVAPTCAWALTSGPSQPEVQSFEPVGTSEMVDLFTGDFNYNIPLLDVDGYPINIAYHSGISMDQEASWVGLGWNINPGVINRTMRGIPDDFKGDQIVKKMKMKPNVTYGLSAGTFVEFWGIGGLGYNIGMHYNNYNGVGIEQCINLSISGSSSNGKGSATVGLGLQSSSEEGLTVQPSLSFQATMSKDEQTGISSGLSSSVGLCYNSRAGLKSLTISGGSSVSKKGFASSMGSDNVSSTYNLGIPTYTPTPPMPMQNSMVTGNFTIGGEVFGVHMGGSMGGYRSYEELKQNSISNPGFGYMNTEYASGNPRAVLDFNREKEGTYSKNTLNLPVTNYTYDIFSVSGQGTGGSYRAFRGEMGNVSDPRNTSMSTGGSIGGEVGMGNLVHTGSDFVFNYSVSSSGPWSSDNLAVKLFKNRHSTGDPLYEPYYFREANEKAVDNDPEFFENQGSYSDRSINLRKIIKFFTIADNAYAQGPNTVNYPIAPQNYRKKREARNQAITTLSRSEMNSDYGLLNLSDDCYQSQNTGHHIAEITSLNKDGSRYVYGIAAYNTDQQEVSFATGSTLKNASSSHPPDTQKGLVDYEPGIDNSEIKNGHGLDNYYSNTIMPPYAHSYLLTAILSPDYVDSEDGIYMENNVPVNLKGPSDGDMGNYTKFEYERIVDYNWRVPFEENKANHNEGLRSLKYDDKGSYIYGKKDLYFLKKIETKNYVAIFDLSSSRKDGFGVIGENGGIDANMSSRLLKKISLYSKKDWQNSSTPIPIKEVHFEYDYSLCPNISNNNGIVENISTPNGTININENHGKLTLKKIYFTYQNSKKGRFSPYEFSYSNNPVYDIKGYDRWGNYKPNPYGPQPSTAFPPPQPPTAPVQAYAPGSELTNELSNAEYPYAEQDKSLADAYAQAWTLKTIKLPSGGEINVEYESDDYAYVQDKKAMQMFKVVGVDNNRQGLAANKKTDFATVDLNSGRASDLDAVRFIVKLNKNVSSTADFKKYYITGMANLYYRFLMEIRVNNYEYVSGYIDESEIADCGIYGGAGEYAWIDISSTFINDTDGDHVVPITKSAVQFGRLNMSRVVWDCDDINVNDDEELSEDVLNALKNSNFAKNIKDARKGSNQALYRNYYVGHEAVMNKSWFRFFNPDGKKLGGGLRVTRIELNDGWDKMTHNSQLNDEENYSTYGQSYSYKLDEFDPYSSSSGVAAYEPQIGGDENPWRIPIHYSFRKKSAPDDLLYNEQPYGECFFPAPSVGYSKVTVTSIHPGTAVHSATGRTVHEFYTSKDFPTIVSQTGVLSKPEADKPFSISKLFKINSKEYLTLSQGYTVQLNDMHGKPKKVTNYSENSTSNITGIVSSVEYKYKSKPYGNGSFQLDNTATIIDSKGDSRQARIGVVSDFVSDFNEQKTIAGSGGAATNVDIVLYGIYPIAQPMVKPIYTLEKTQFRYAVITKVIQSFGLLEETIQKDGNALSGTRNLAYDAETGNVILTQDSTNFGDPVYSLTFPAYWYYENMGPAYRNIGFVANLSFDQDGVALVNNASAYYTEGDELALASHKKGWIAEVTPYSIKVIDKSGNPVHTPTDDGVSKILRSGRRNQQDLPMATIKTLQDPLQTISSNIYTDVLQSEAIEYSNVWKTHCDCYSARNEGKGGPYYSTNAFTLATKGFWKNKRAFKFLGGRKQTNYNSNTNIRNDGTYTSFIPYYRFNGNNWEVDGREWTFATAVSEFGPTGQELENVDALGNYSSAVYGYNQTLPLAVASNAKYKQIGFDNFEDYNFSTCADNHFKFKQENENWLNSSDLLFSEQAHSGKKSARVLAGHAATMGKQILECPTPYCDLDLVESYINDQPGVASYYAVYFVGGKAPFVVSWNIISGTPNVSLNGHEVVVDGSGFEVDITVKDANGCMMLHKITH